MPKTQEWIKEKLREEGSTEYTNRRATLEILELKQRISDLELVIEDILNDKRL